MKSILFDGHVLDGPPQGTSTYIVEMALALSNSNRIFVACNNKSSFEKYFNNIDNIYFCKLKFKNKYLRLIFDFLFITFKNNIDISIFQYMSPFLVKGKVIVVIHDVLFLDYPQYFPLIYRLSKKFLYYISAKRADFLISVSEYSKAKIAHHFSVDNKNIYVTPNAVNIKKFRDSAVIPTLESEKFFLYVSRVEPRKNHKVLIKALANLKCSAVKLVFAGSSTIDVNLLELIEEHGLVDRVIFLQPCDQELSWLYKNCCAHFYPSYCEGFGIPPLEAKLLGAPSYIADNTALRELVNYVDGKFDSDDILSITKLMSALCTNENIEFSDFNQNSILSSFSWQSSSETINNLVKGKNND